MDAALVTACVNATRINNDKGYDPLTNLQPNSRVDVKVRVYVHFAPMTIVVPDGYSYRGCIFAPYRVEQVKLTTLKAKTMYTEHCFKISGKKVHNINEYMRTRIKSDEMQQIWEFYLHEMIRKYRDEIRKKYNSIVSMDSFDYTIEFCSEVA